MLFTDAAKIEKDSDGKKDIRVDATGKTIIQIHPLLAHNNILP